MSQNQQGASSAELILSAVQSSFRAQRDRCVAQLSIYVKSHVGVPDHPNVVDECTDLVRQIAEAEECLKVINSLFVPADATVRMQETNNQ